MVLNRSDYEIKKNDSKSTRLIWDKQCLDMETLGDRTYNIEKEEGLEYLGLASNSIEKWFNKTLQDIYGP